MTCFRDEVQKLSPAQKLRIYSIEDFSYPCQVEIILLENRRLGLHFQLMIFQHFSDKPDLEVIVHGPISLSKAIDEFEKILVDEKWGRRENPEKNNLIENDEPLSEALQLRLLLTLEDLKNAVISLAFLEFPEQPIGIREQSPLGDKSFTWFGQGDMLSLEPTKMIREIVEHVTKEIPQTQLAHKPRSSLIAFGTYFYPAIWIEDTPGRTFGEKIRHQPAGFFNGKCSGQISQTYNDSPIIVQEDGLTAIITSDKAKALQMLNEIMGMALVLGLPCLAVREPEVFGFEIDEETRLIMMASMFDGTNRTRLVGETMEGYWIRSVSYEHRRIISREDLTYLLSSADMIMRDIEVRESISFLLESYTHLQSSEYPQCFVMSWTVVERYIITLWQEFLNGKAISGKRRQKFRQGLLWTTDDILETLELANSLERKRYQSFMSLKNKRNKILHRGETATEEVAKECFTVASDIVMELVKKYGVVRTICPQTKWLGF